MVDLLTVEFEFSYPYVEFSFASVVDEESDNDEGIQFTAMTVEFSFQGSD